MSIDGSLYAWIGNEVSYMSREQKGVLWVWFVSFTKWASVFGILYHF
jgi:hypothetical protein